MGFPIFFASIFQFFVNICSCFFEARFRYRFLIAFLMENGSKMTSKIDHRVDLCDQKGVKVVHHRLAEAVPEPTFFRASFFQCFQVPFRRHFGQGSALLAPFWLPGSSFWNPRASFWSFRDDFSCFLDNRFRDRFLIALLSASTQITKNWVTKREKNKPTNHKETNQ